MPKDTKIKPKGIPLAEKNNLITTPGTYTPEQLFKPLTDKEKRANLNIAHKSVNKPSVRALKKAEKSRQALAAGALDTNRNKSSENGHPVEKLKSNRQQNLATANVLRGRAYSASDKLWSTSNKIKVCSMFGAFRVLSEDVANKIGQACCRCRLCPTCQRILALKRQDKLMKFCELNKVALSKYYIYHFVVTLRHSKDDDVRDFLYVSQLVALFKLLRGVTGRSTEQRSWWDQRVAGGLYSVELTPGRDGSPHIHLHVVLLANMPLWRKDGRVSKFLAEARLRWLALTGDSSNLYIEPIYRLVPRPAQGPAGAFDEHGQRVDKWLGLGKAAGVDKEYYQKPEAGDVQEADLDVLKAAFVECAKYTLKSDAEALDQFSDQFLEDLVATRNRYFGRFGCLHSRDKRADQFKKLELLNTNFKDIDEVDEKRARQFYNPETAEIQHPNTTFLAVTPFSNAQPKSVATAKLKKDEPLAVSEDYYNLVNPAKVRLLPYDADKQLPKALAVTIYEKYEPENDII